MTCSAEDPRPTSGSLLRSHAWRCADQQLLNLFPRSGFKAAVPPKPIRRATPSRKTPNPRSCTPASSGSWACSQSLDILQNHNFNHRPDLRTAHSRNFGLDVSGSVWTVFSGTTGSWLPAQRMFTPGPRLITACKSLCFNELRRK